MAEPIKLSARAHGHHTKRELSARAEAEARLMTCAKLDPPDWLCDTAAEEFTRCAAVFAELGMLNELDLAALAMYADAYATFVEASEALLEEPLVVEYSNGSRGVSPWVKVKEGAAQTIFACSRALGIACSDRLRLCAPPKKEAPKNKFLEALGHG